ncbi:MAG TPA: hypothetical protein VFJ72_11030 [Rubrobacteraceae bacterium]|nr:hypothetical protein [Rubrobacteraceae bacterium]
MRQNLDLSREANPDPDTVGQPLTFNIKDTNTSDTITAGTNVIDRACRPA